MKCVKITLPKGSAYARVFLRVSDAQAARHVRAGWSYCPKSEWKAVNRKEQQA